MISTSMYIEDLQFFEQIVLKPIVSQQAIFCDISKSKVSINLVGSIDDSLMYGKKLMIFGKRYHVFYFIFIMLQFYD